MFFYIRSLFHIRKESDNYSSGDFNHHLDKIKSSKFSEIRKNIQSDMKQYTVAGYPVGESYPLQIKSEKDQLTNELIAKTSDGKLFSRKNAGSPYLTRIITGGALSKVKRTSEQNQMGNKLAVLINHSPEISPYFSVDIYRGKKDGHDTYMARRIYGFSMDNKDRIAQALQANILSLETIHKKLTDLSKAVEWLNQHGYYHNDIHLGNIMYDERNQVFVLIDFEYLERGGGNRIFGEYKLIHAIRDVILPEAIDEFSKYNLKKN